MISIDEINFDGRGLVPAIVQDADSGRVLTLAYMNRESLEITLREERTCFWSRSRQELWRKGETSGNVQHVVSVAADCDRDAILVRVKKDGPACHLGGESCFEFPMTEEADGLTVDGLYGLLLSRRETLPENSYTTYLFQKGREKILKKVGEECTEVIIGAMKDSKEETVYELADLCYHAMVLMAEMGITPNEVRSELASRHVVDKKTKQETMK